MDKGRLHPVDSGIHFQQNLEDASGYCARADGYLVCLGPSYLHRTSGSLSHIEDMRTTKKLYRQSRTPSKTSAFTRNILPHCAKRLQATTRSLRNPATGCRSSTVSSRNQPASVPSKLVCCPVSTLYHLCHHSDTLGRERKHSPLRPPSLYSLGRDDDQRRRMGQHTHRSPASIGCLLPGAPALLRLPVCV